MHTSPYEQALEFLLSRINYETAKRIPYGSGKLKLERMRRLLSLMGDPHLQAPAIHVAGTKGKGSTAAMIAAMLAGSGIKGGLYTSPHLEHLEERIVVDGERIERDTLVSLVEEIRPVVVQLDSEASRREDRPTYFELVTSLAMLHFARQQVDYSVLEVGMGGRLDSTNVCQPAVCIITSISYDHVAQLGPTLADIAREKAGIIKSGVPVICGVLEPEPQAVIHAIAAERGAPILQIGRDFSIELTDSGFDFQSDGCNLPNIQLQLKGEHQRSNAALAIAAVKQLTNEDRITDASIRQSLQTARVAGRIETVRQQPLTIVDVAHNAASIQALLKVLKADYNTKKQKTLIFACSSDKDVSGMLEPLVEFFDTVVLTRYVNNPRSTDIEKLLACTKQYADAHNPDLNILTASDPPTAWRMVSELAQPDDLVCVTGSFFIAAELRAVIRS